MALVRPAEAFNSTLPSVPGGVVLGTSDILRDDNPHVLAHPEMFVEVTETFLGVAGLVEEATAVPGRRKR